MRLGIEAVPVPQAAPRTRRERLRRGPRPAVLVVDDDPVGCQATAMVLEREGYAAEWTTDPREALERAARWPYALVVSDVQMPAIRGTALAAELARVRPGMRVMLLSAFADPLTITEATALGVPLLPKPVSTEALLAMVARLTADRPAPGEDATGSGR